MSASKLFTMVQKAGESFIDTKEAPEFSAGDFKGWEQMSHETAGLFFFMFKIEPHAEEFPLHASPDDWLSYVVSGSGTLFAGVENGRKTQQVEFKAGDFIEFQPDTQHAWQSSSEETKIMFLKVA